MQRSQTICSKLEHTRANHNIPEPIRTHQKGELLCGILLFTFIHYILPKLNTMELLRSQRFPARKAADQSLLLLLLLLERA
jgi:hypothetical protein